MSTPAIVRSWESHAAQYRTLWRSNLLSSVVQPLLYLLGMGVGVGALVDRGEGASNLDGLTYFQFLAPALIATSAMMVTSNESLWQLLGQFKWVRTFHAQAATPLTPRQIAGGLALWHLTKATIAASGVAVVLVLFSETRGLGLVAAVPFGALTGVAISAPLAAWTSSRETEHSFPTINRFVIMPLFLFGGAFYPVDQLPDWLQPVARATPLWHGVELTRGAVTGRWELGSALLHVAVLCAFTAVGWTLMTRTFTRRLTL